MTPECNHWSAQRIASEIRQGRISPVEVVDAALARLEEVDRPLGVMITRCDDQARDEARRLEAALARGDEAGPLCGVPLAVKDLHQTGGLRTTLGSRLFEQHIPERDEPLVRRLKEAGCIVIGKSNTSEFGVLPLTMNSLVGDARNPYDPARNAGGSSGGSAVSVATGVCPLATGNDGGGSIRIPAAFCGVFGLKPQFGRVPHPSLPRGWESLSHQGPIARHVRDAALMLDVMSGPDACDRWSLPEAGHSFLAGCEGEVGGLRLAWSPHLGQLPVEPDVLQVCRQAVARFEELGCQVDEVSLDLPDLCRAQQIIVQCETAVSMREQRAQWEQVIFPLISRMLPQADQLTYFDLMEAQWARDDYWRRLAPLFETYDALLTPTCGITATEAGTLGPREVAGEKIRALGWLAFVVPFNMTWQPAASLPVGQASDGLPVGLQLVGRRFDEVTLLRLAARYEDAFGFLPPPA